MVFIQMFGKTAINCFTLITKYYLIELNITVKKFLSTYLEVKFYYFISYLAFLCTGYEAFSIKRGYLRPYLAWYTRLEVYIQAHTSCFSYLFHFLIL